MANKINVVILEDHQSIIDGYLFRLSKTPEIDVVATIGYGEDVEPTLAKFHTDVLLLSVNVPTALKNNNPYPIFHIISKMLKLYPKLVMLVISMVSERKLIHAVMNAGAKGYILKDDQIAMRDLGNAIISAANGAIYFSEEAHRLFLKSQADDTNFLTIRQLEIISLVAAYPNASTTDLAQKMSVSQSTARNILSGAYIRLGVNTRFGMITKAREIGFIGGIPLFVESEIRNMPDKVSIPAKEIQPPNIIEINKRTKVITDQPNGPDQLNVTRYANAFAELITNPEMNTPITIGIYGHWGSGKSFLMGKIKEALHQTKSKRRWHERRSAIQKTEPDIHVIEFNAWVYSGSEHLWASLVTHLYRDIEKYYGLKANFKRLERVFRRSFPKVLGVFAFYGLIGFAMSLLLNSDKIQKSADDMAVAINTAAGLLLSGSALASIPALWSVLRDFFDSLFLSRASKLQKLAAKPDFSSQIGVMADIKDEIKFVRELFKTGKNGKNKTRLVLFIDDLDRCEHHKAVEVLQAIMLLLADDDASPFVIFLGIDVRVIISAIEENYGEVLVKAGINGYEYLDKIIQIPFAIPAASRSDIDNYVESLIWSSDDEKKIVTAKTPQFTSELLSEILEDNELQQTQALEPELPSETKESEPKPASEEISVTFTRAEREALKACVANLTDNPRKIKRIINIYRLARLILPEAQDQRQAIRWILMTEQWPLHVAWLIECIENDVQIANHLKGKTIVDVYKLAKKGIHVKEMKTLLDIDADIYLFERFIKQEPVFTIAEIQSLMPYTFSLNPAIRAEVNKQAIVLPETKPRVPRNKKKPAISMIVDENKDAPL